MESINRELLQRNLHSLKQLLRSNIPSLSIKVGNFLGYFLASVLLFSLFNPCFWFSILMIYYFNKHGWHSPSFLFHLCNYLTSSRDHLKGDKFHFLPKMIEGDSRLLMKVIMPPTSLYVKISPNPLNT